MKNRAYLTAAVMAVIVVVNICLMTGLFKRPEDILTAKLVSTADFTFHQYFSKLGSQSLRQSGAAWGYDPTFMAGSLYSPVFDPSNYLFELVAALLPFFSIALVVKLIMIIGIGCIPLLIFKAARNMQLDGPMSVTAGFFAGAYLWFGLPLEVTRYGMVLYVLGAAWGIFVFGWWMRLAEQGDRASGAGLVISCALSIPVHIATFFVVAVPGLLSLVMHIRRLDRKRWSWIAAAVLITVICSLPWMGPNLAFKSLKTSSAVHLQSIPFWGVILLAKSGQASLEILMLLLGTVGFIALRRESPVRRWAPLLAGVITLIALYFSGRSSVQLSELQPRRFAIPLYFLLAIPAAKGAAMLIGWLTSFANRKLRAVVITLLLIALIPAFYRSATSIGSVMGSVLTGTPPGVGSMFAWMNNSTDKSGRILIEDSSLVEPLALAGVKEGMSFLGMIPLFVDREFIGGPWARTYIKPHFVDFNDGKLLQKPIIEYDARSLSNVFKLYNIKWAVSFSYPANQLFAGLPELIRPIGSTGPFQIWEVADRSGNFFFKGSGILSARPNEIKVEKAIPDNGELVLKYHWMPCMKVEPQGQIRRVSIPEDPIGFLGVTGAPADFRIVPDYSRAKAWLPFCGKL